MSLKLPRWSSLPAWSGVLLLEVLLFIFMAISQPEFVSAGNLSNIVRSAAIPIVLGIGMTYTILTAGIDLSVGSVLAFSGILLSGMIDHMPRYAAVVVTIALVTLIVGGINGTLIGRFGLNSFVVTLGSLGIFRGISYLVTNGTTQNIDAGPLIRALGDGNVGPVPGPLLVVIVLAAISIFVLRSTFFGRDVYAVGGNEFAAQLAGIYTGRVKMNVYVISAACAGLAGVMQVGRLDSAAPTAGAGLELAVVAGVLLGGTRLSGGVGSITGTVIGVLFLQTVSNSLTIQGVSSYWQQIVTGVLLGAAVLFDRIRLELSSRAPSRKDKE
ncbi:MAG: ABC transporter permease [Actinobacteria bacterium]|jgi:ribose/xylose/arabinose/galactoside ABC-type transport system permease subunit|nr:ABC transporter permease [Actinomycetota bacterium]